MSHASKCLQGDKHPTLYPEFHTDVSSYVLCVTKLQYRPVVNFYIQLWDTKVPAVTAEHGYQYESTPGSRKSHHCILGLVSFAASQSICSHFIQLIHEMQRLLSNHRNKFYFLNKGCGEGERS